MSNSEMKKWGSNDTNENKNKNMFKIAKNRDSILSL